MAVCCLDEGGTWGRDLEATGVSVTALRRRPGFHPALGREVARAARRHGATVIHAHHYSPFVYSAIARLWRGPRVIFTEHGRLSDKGPSTKRRLANQVFSTGAAHVYTVSRELGQHLVAEGFPSAKVSTIYNGIDVGPRPSEEDRRAIRELLGASADAFVVCTVARLDPVKDLATLIDAVARLANQTPTLLAVIGDGDERGRLEQAARDCGVSHLVRFLGHRDDARRWLAGCDVYANSSISEGISLTILEAMAATLPVVATSVGGTPEIVEDSCGRLVPPRDPGALAAALLEMACRREIRRALGQAARARVEQNFTIQRMVGDYAAVYAE